MDSIICKTSQKTVHCPQTSLSGGYKNRDAARNDTVWDDVATMRALSVGPWVYFVSLKPRYIPS